MSNEENLEPVVEETTEPTEEQAQEEFDPDAPTMSARQMSYLLTNQTFAFCASIGQALKDRYDQMTTNVPPKVKKSEYNKGYLTALNDVAAGLMAYQNEVTLRAVADGILTPEDAAQFLPTFPTSPVPVEEEQPAPEVDGQSE
jgi:hypothetical protein